MAAHIVRAGRKWISGELWSKNPFRKRQLRRWRWVNINKYLTHIGCKNETHCICDIDYDCKR